MSPTGHKFWSHKLYRGPQDQPVRIMYSRTKVESEEIAREFINEKVVGFDMEWPWRQDTNPNAALQQRVGLIQIACEDKIALFHIGLHSGTSPNDLLAPSLRSIIESPDISKCGVAVLNADFSRLQTWFGLQPRGAFELSHLHNLVTYGAVNPAKCTIKLRKLAQQVEEHLGLPLHKGAVRTSNWSNPLNQNQIQYAAADSYAGFMLFHCMNAKRISMLPTPPLPVYAETYVAMNPRSRDSRSFRLLAVVDNGKSMTVLDFFQSRAESDMTAEADRPSLRAEAKSEDGRGSFETCEGEIREPDDRPLPPSFKEALELVRVRRRGRHIMLAEAGGVDSNVVDGMRVQYAAGQERRENYFEPTAAPRTIDGGHRRKEVRSVPRPAKVDATETRSQSRRLNEGQEEALFRRLRAHRKVLAHGRKCAPFIIAHDTLLHAISRQCPRDDHELMSIRGVGEMKMADFGQVWLSIVRNFVAEADPGKSREAVFGVSTELARGDRLPTASSLPVSLPKLEMPVPNVHRAESAMSVSVSSAQTTPVLLHTGVSFSMGCTELGDGVGDVGENVGLALDGDPGLDGADGPSSGETSAFGGHFRSSSPSSGCKRKRDERAKAAAEDAAISARPGWPTRPPPPILSDANQQKQGEQPVLGPASTATATTETSPVSRMPQESDKARPAQLSSSRSGSRPQSPAYLTPEFQVPSVATQPTPLRSIPPPAKRLAGVGETPRPAHQPIQAVNAHSIFRKKLVAFNKLVTATVQLSPVTIDHIVARPPGTVEDLLRIPGIIPFANACSRANHDFLAFIVKSTPTLSRVRRGQ